MATIQIYEGFPSRESVLGGDSPSVVLNWVVLGTSDDIVAKSLVRAYTPPAYDGLILQNVTSKETAPKTWECQANYGSRKPPKENEYKFAFDTTGGRQKITQSLDTVGKYAPAGKTAADHKGAIGVTDHGVAGCEIVVPKFSWSETWQLPIVDYGWGYSQTLKAVTGRVNAVVFRGFAAGQVLFRGAKGSASNNATVMSWRGMKGAVAAARSGHDYVATPNPDCYLDHDIKRFSLERAYALVPIPASLNAQQAKHCLGVQGNLWTEHVPTPAIMDRQVWPRLCAGGSRLDAARRARLARFLRPYAVSQLAVGTGGRARRCRPPGGGRAQVAVGTPDCSVRHRRAGLPPRIPCSCPHDHRGLIADEFSPLVDGGDASTCLIDPLDLCEAAEAFNVVTSHKPVDYYVTPR